MKRLYKSLCFTVLLICLHQTYANSDLLIDQNIQNIIDSDRITFNIPAIQVSILYPEEGNTHDFVSGTTTLAGDAPVTATHLFQIGSQTKSFIATIALQLEAEGKLSINDAVGKWLPQIEPAWRDITLKQLLNHSSGIHNYTDTLAIMMMTDKQFDLQKQWTAEELLELAAKQSPYFAPGMGWHYSNTNYVLAGLVLEAVSGRSIQEEIETRLIQPIQLKHTSYISTLFNPAFMKRMAHGYAQMGIFGDEPKDITATNHSWLNAAGAIVASSHDTAIWFANLTSGSILPQKQMNELMHLIDQNNGQSIPKQVKANGYGLGIKHDFTSFGEEAWWHSGGTLGYSSLMVRLICSNIIITTNVSHITNITPEGRDTHILINHLIDYLRTVRDC